jgi:hypothetical protein
MVPKKTGIFSGVFCSFTRNQRCILRPAHSPKFAIFHYSGHRNVSTGSYVVVLQLGHHKINEYSSHRLKFLIKHVDGISSVATHPKYFIGRGPGCNTDRDIDTFLLIYNGKVNP